MSAAKTPIIVGVGQITQRAGVRELPEDPLSLMAESARVALDDPRAPHLRKIVDQVVVVNTLTWSYADAPGMLAERLGLRPDSRIYSAIGGNTPQSLVNRAAVALSSGVSRAVLLAGAEAGASTSRSQTARELLAHWPARAEPLAVDGDTRQGVSGPEQDYGLFLPSSMYPLIETAIRARAGRTPLEHRAFLGDLFARFAQVAATNPFAWFPHAHTGQRIATPTPDNRYVGYPYTKLMNAIMSVDQAAAIVMTTEGEAARVGIDRDSWVYPMGGGELNDVWYVTERPRLDRSPAIAGAARRALSQAGCSVDEITEFDLYSCFPAAVQLALEALGIDAGDPRPLTVSGGLPYFGGPGNNYSMHAIATAVERIRGRRDTKVLVSALGWYCTKHAVGVYGSSRPRSAWRAAGDAAEQAAIDRTGRPPLRTEAAGRAKVEAFVIRHGRDGAPIDAVGLVGLDDGARALADIDGDGPALREMEDTELVGREGSIRHDRSLGRNRLRID